MSTPILRNWSLFPLFPTAEVREPYLWMLITITKLLTQILNSVDFYTIPETVKYHESEKLPFTLFEGFLFLLKRFHPLYVMREHGKWEFWRMKSKDEINKKYLCAL